MIFSQAPANRQVPHPLIHGTWTVFSPIHGFLKNGMIGKEVLPINAADSSINGTTTRKYSVEDPSDKGLPRTATRSPCAIFHRRFRDSDNKLFQHRPVAHRRQAHIRNRPNPEFPGIRAPYADSVRLKIRVDQPRAIPKQLGQICIRCVCESNCLEPASNVSTASPNRVSHENVHQGLPAERQYSESDASTA